MAAYWYVLSLSRQGQQTNGERGSVLALTGPAALKTSSCQSHVALMNLLHEDYEDYED